MTASHKTDPDYMGFLLPLSAMAIMIWFLVG